MVTSQAAAVDALLQLMARLRDPEKGCPWDVRQTFESIAPYTLEEAYEVADAIEQGDMPGLCEELGDLLFQVVFHARMAEEQGLFDFGQVCRGITAKMQRRHPHVFGDAQAGDEQRLRQAWEQAKSRERAGKQEDDSRLAGVARALPALLRAHKLQRRAADAGFDWPDVGGALDKLGEETREVAEAAASGDRDHLEEELGDLLFAMVNVVRLYGFQAERVMRRANDKFERRFRRMEQRLAEQGGEGLEGLSLEQMELAWEAVKKEESE
jgi:MazG family protein